MNVGMWVASMPACAGSVNKHTFPFISVFSKIGSRSAEFGSKFSLPLCNKNLSGPKVFSLSSKTAYVNTQNNRPMELKDDQAEPREDLYTRWGLEKDGGTQLALALFFISVNNALS